MMDFLNNALEICQQHPFKTTFGAWCAIGLGANIKMVYTLYKENNDYNKRVQEAHREEAIKHAEMQWRKAKASNNPKVI